jgi:hypothetical protein
MRFHDEINRFLCAWPICRWRGGLVLGTLAALFLMLASMDFGPVISAEPQKQDTLPAQEAKFESSGVHGFWTHLKLPAHAANLALSSAGAWATASSTNNKCEDP